MKSKDKLFQELQRAQQKLINEKLGKNELITVAFWESEVNRLKRELGLM